MVYLNRVEPDKQVDGFLRNGVKMEVGIIGNGGFERVESRLDKGEVFELPESS